MASPSPVLPPAAQTALIILSYLPAGFDLLLGTRLLASMSHPQALQPAGILDRLCRFKLVQFDADSGTFVMQVGPMPPAALPRQRPHVSAQLDALMRLL